MRENRQSGSEGGETFGLPYPYPGAAEPLPVRRRSLTPPHRATTWTTCVSPAGLGPSTQATAGSESKPKKA